MIADCARRVHIRGMLSATAPVTLDVLAPLSRRLVADSVDVTVVLPCLNESKSLPHCIQNARAALEKLRSDYALSGEIIVADNGSGDGSQMLAESLGARVVAVPARGYGAALIGGCEAASGRYILLGDCDGSYDFLEGVAMVAKLHEGYDICLGSRFTGRIMPGAMPWKNRYIGNPLLTGILNLFFRARITDAHCGLRALRSDAFRKLKLAGTGMEFASEMVVKAALLKLKTTEVPATLSPDLRQRAPHLRPWRDGWRHLRFLFMLSPTWVFGFPAIGLLAMGATILLTACAHALGWTGPIAFGESWIVIGALAVVTGHMTAIMAVASHLYGFRQGYRLPKPWLLRFNSALSLEGCLLAGMVLIILSAAGLMLVGIRWGQGEFSSLPSILPVALAGITGTIGLQTLLGGFLLAVVGGNRADFLSGDEAR